MLFSNPCPACTWGAGAQGRGNFVLWEAGRGNFVLRGIGALQICFLRNAETMKKRQNEIFDDRVRTSRTPSFENSTSRIKFCHPNVPLKLPLARTPLHRKVNIPNQFFFPTYAPHARGAQGRRGVAILFYGRLGVAILFHGLVSKMVA